MDNPAQDNQNLQNTQGIGSNPPAPDANTPSDTQTPHPFPMDDTNAMAPPPPPVIDGNIQTDEISGTEPSFISPKPKTGINGKLIGAIFGILILAAAVGAGAYLTKQNQELREEASGDYGWDGNCYTDTGARIVNLYKCSPEEWSDGPCNKNGIQNNCFDLSFCGVMQLDVGCLPEPPNDTECNIGGYASTRFLDNRGVCTGTPPPGQPTPPPGDGCGATCRDSSECLSGLSCFNRACWSNDICGGSSTPPPVTCQDSVTCEDGTVCSPGQECRFASGDGYWYCGQRKDCATPTPHPTATPGPIGASCKNIKAFDANWNKLDAAALAGLNAGDTVRFTVRGESLEGDFTKARFTINGQLQPVTRQIRPGVPEEFYTEYVIPDAVTQFTIGAEVYHNIKDKWF